MENKVEFSPAYLEAVKNLKLAHEMLVKGHYQGAYDLCINAQVEIKLLSNAVKTWIPIKENV